MTRCCAAIIVVSLAAVTTPACTLGTPPTAPSVVSSPPVTSVPTATPDVWDSREELAAWMQSGASRSSITLVGDGTDAVIRVDNSGGTALLHGPDLQSEGRTVSRARVRYRWVGRSEGEGLLMTIYLRPPVLDASLHVPQLFHGPGLDLSKPPEENSGDWVDQDFTDHNVNASPPPYLVLFPTLEIRSLYPGPIHGFVEIDRIVLFR